MCDPSEVEDVVVAVEKSEHVNVLRTEVFPVSCCSELMVWMLLELLCVFFTITADSPAWTRDALWNTSRPSAQFDLPAAAHPLHHWCWTQPGVCYWLPLLLNSREHCKTFCFLNLESKQQHLGDSGWNTADPCHRAVVCSATWAWRNWCSLKSWNLCGRLGALQTGEHVADSNTVAPRSHSHYLLNVKWRLTLFKKFYLGPAHVTSPQPTRA